jgi:hypothetical protein
VVSDPCAGKKVLSNLHRVFIDPSLSAHQNKPVDPVKILKGKKQQKEPPELPFGMICIRANLISKKISAP